MIVTVLTTLESSGPNKPLPMDSNCRVLGMTSMTDNATTTARSGGIDRGGIGPGVDRNEALENRVNLSNDTTLAEVPAAGTVESQGANG